MISFIKINKKHRLNVFYNLKKRKILYFNLFNIIFISKKNKMYLDKIYNNKIINSKTLETKNPFFYSSFDIKYIHYSDENQILNFDIAKILFKISEKYYIKYEKEYDMDFITLKASIYNKEDLIYEFYYEYDYLPSPYNDLNNIIKRKTIMSAEAEEHNIKKISEELSKYDLDLYNYTYEFIYVNKNICELALTHKINNKNILIKNIILDDYNRIISFGLNNGLVM